MTSRLLTTKRYKAITFILTGMYLININQIFETAGLRLLQYQPRREFYIQDTTKRQTKAKENWNEILKVTCSDMESKNKNRNCVCMCVLVYASLSLGCV